jgi:integrase/recombinase XerD
MKNFTGFPGLLESFFTDRLMRQRQASPHTVASYVDTFRLLFAFAEKRFKKAPSELALGDLDAPFIGAFLDHLEKERRISARSRNTRLAAIHSFFRYAALHDQGTWAGCRDRALLLTAVQTGLRVSELTGLRCRDVILSNGSSYVHCRGKGRKERCTPLRKEAVAALRSWLRQHDGQDSDPLFPNARGASLSRDGVEYILKKHVTVARQGCSSLKKKRVSPHVLRHTAAMDMLDHGIPCSVIALWFGHEREETTKMYLEASLELKEKALAKTSPLKGRVQRYHPEDSLLTFLKGL